MNQLPNSHQNFCGDFKYLVLWKNFAAASNYCRLTDKQGYNHVEDNKKYFWKSLLKYVPKIYFII